MKSTIFNTNLKFFKSYSWILIYLTLISVILILCKATNTNRNSSEFKSRIRFQINDETQSITKFLNISEIQLNQDPESSTPITQIKSCPSKEFFSFLNRYMNEDDIQKKFTRYPLLYSYNNFDVDESKKITNIIQENDLIFPLISNDFQRLALNYQVAISDINNNLVKATIYTPHSDYPILHYYFFYTNECWELIALEDDSVSG